MDISNIFKQDFENTKTGANSSVVNNVSGPMKTKDFQCVTANDVLNPCNSLSARHRLLSEEEHNDITNFFTIYRNRLQSHRDLNGDIEDTNDSIKSKDEILRQAMFNIVISNDVSKNVTESFLKMLSEYGIAVPKTKAALISEFQNTNETYLSQQYEDLNKRITKMESSLEQIKYSLTKPILLMGDNIPVQNDADLNLLKNQCTENDLIAHPFKHMIYVTDEYESISLKEGDQGKKKNSRRVRK